VKKNPGKVSFKILEFNKSKSKENITSPLGVNLGSSLENKNILTSPKNNPLLYSFNSTQTKLNNLFPNLNSKDYNSTSKDKDNTHKKNDT